MSCTKEPGTPSCNIGAIECLRSLRAPDNGGSSIGDVPLCGDRVEFDDVSEINDGAPSADICEKADGEGSGVSIIICDRSAGPFDGTLMGCGMCP